MKLENIYRIGLDVGSTTIKMALLDCEGNILHSRYERHNAQVRPILHSFLSDIRDGRAEGFVSDGSMPVAMAVTGSVGMGIADLLKIPFVQEVVAATEYVKEKYPQSKVMIDIGGEDSKVVFFNKTGNADLRMNGNCAGGTGAFIDQMSVLLGLDIPQMNDSAMSATEIHPIAARCGVFSKTDIQNLLSRNVSKGNIAASVFHAVAVQTVAALSRGHDFSSPVLLCGGPLTFIPALRKAFADYLKMTEGDFILPEQANLLPAFGCALSAASTAGNEKVTVDSLLYDLENTPIRISYKSLPPLFSTEKQYEEWKQEKSAFRLKRAPFAKGPQEVVLGIDSGSTTTKIVVMNKEKEIIFSYYSPNLGNPIGAVLAGLGQLDLDSKAADAELQVVGSCSTGYGEDLVRTAYGLDSGIIETMAHYQAAKELYADVSFILDIGGQDMKAVFVQQGAVTRMELNEACSSGCGSFIETFASTLKYAVSDFAAVACAAKNPCDLGTRCTVFMNSKVKQVLREGASIPDIAAGLSYSVIRNCLFKVLKLQHPREEMGARIVLQGGAMKNDSVVRAFELLSGTDVARCDTPELMGAYGCALHSLAALNVSKPLSGLPIRRPLDAFLINKGYETRIGACHGCENKCSVTTYVFSNGSRFFSGNKCEKVFNNGRRSAEKGLDAYPEKYHLLFDRYDKAVRPDHEDPSEMTVGIPRVLNMYENYPFWHSLFSQCGITDVLSDNSVFSSYEKALSSVMSDNICFPAKLAHSHIANLLTKGVKRIFMPYVVFEKKEDEWSDNSYNCPIVTAYSDVIRNSMLPNVPVDSPAVTFADRELLARQCVSYLKTFGIPAAKVRNAVSEALKVQDEFDREIRKANLDILEKSRNRGGLSIMLVGRPYHADPLVQHKVSEMISDLGVNVISDDIVRNDDLEVKDSYLIKQWAYPNRILKAAQWAAMQDDDVQLVQLTSFGCGPDAFLLDEVRNILNRHGKPFTMLKIDDINSLGSLKLRVRSLIESLRLRPAKRVEMPYVTTKVFSTSDVHKKILAPHISSFLTPLLPPIFKMMGYDLEVLPPSDGVSSDIGLEYSNNEVCYPATLIVGDIIKALKSGKYDLDNVVVAMSQTGGQCRATNYLSIIKRAMVNAGFENVPVLAVGVCGKDTINEQGGFSIDWKKIFPIALAVMLFSDTISKFYYASKVRETEKGISMKLRDKYLETAYGEIANNNPKGLLRIISSAAKEFNGIVNARILPKVGIVGEIFLKFNSYAHQDIAKFLMDRGMEVIPPTFTSFFLQEFVNHKFNRKNNVHRSGAMEDLSLGLLYRYAKSWIGKFNKAGAEFRYFDLFPDIFDVSKGAEGIVSEAAQFGEGWLLPAEVADFANLGVENVVSLQPFGCIANHILSKGIENKVRILYPDLNFLTLDFDSSVSSVNVTNRIMLFLNNIHKTG